MKIQFRSILGLLFGLCCLGNVANADYVLVSEFFTGRIQAFDVNTKEQRTFATVDSGSGLSGLAFNAANNTVYASAFFTNRIYRFNATTGEQLGFLSVGDLGIAPGGLTVGPSGNVYISNFDGDNIVVFNSMLTNQIDTITVPGVGATSGVGFLNNGELLISTPGTGVFRYDGTDITEFANNPLAMAQIATDAFGNTFIGHGIGFSNFVYRYDENGNPQGAIEITPAMVGSIGGTSPGTSPGGVAFDPNGRLFVAALGRSRPEFESDQGEIGERGGLFLFDINAGTYETFATASNGFSSVVYVTPIPEPSTIWLLVAGGSLMGMIRRRR